MVNIIEYTTPGIVLNDMLFPVHRGTLYVTGNSSGESTVDATPRKIAALATKGVEVGLTVDTAGSQVTIAVAGDYMVVGTISFSGTLSKTFNVAIYKNTSTTNFALERKMGTGGDVGSAAVSGIVTCAATDDISLYQSSTDGGTAFTALDAQLSVMRIG